MDWRNIKISKDGRARAGLGVFFNSGDAKKATECHLF
jgi:hypothetical protein